MDTTLHASNMANIEVTSTILNIGALSSRLSSSTLAAPIITLLALLIPLSTYYIYQQRQKTKARRTEFFHFTSLPRELRDLVYGNLLTEHVYPVPRPVPPPVLPSWMNLNSQRWIARWQLQATPSIFPHILPPFLLPASSWTNTKQWLARSCSRPTRQSTRIILANKQLHAEFMDLMCRKRTLHLTVSPSNYINTSPLPLSSFPPTTTTATTTTTAAPPPTKKIWNISPSTLSQTRTATLRLITTSRMLGVTDPRNMKSEDWGLAQHIQRELSGMTKVGEFALEVTAVGDPLWNPLWIWWHARRGVGNMGLGFGESGRERERERTSVSTCVGLRQEQEQGPRFTKITFSLDTWSPGENHLRRDEEGEWVWCCGEGHVVGKDGGRDMPIREFCARLYLECGVCRGE